MPKFRIGPVIRIAATLAAFGLGVYGFELAYGGNGPLGRRLFTDAFRSLQLVIGQFPDSLQDRPLPLPLQIARWALPVLAGWTSVELAWMQVRNRVRLRWISWRGAHLVVAGEGALAAQIVAAERHAKRPVLVWVEDARDRWVQDAADLGAPNLPLARGEAILKDLGLGRAATLLLAGPDGAANVALAARAMEFAFTARDAGDPLNLIARVDDPDLRAPLEQRFDRLTYRAAVRLRFASLPDIAARRLFLLHSLDRFDRIGAEGRTVVVLGFSPTMEQYLLRLLAAGHYRDGVAPKLVVIDPAADHKQTVFFARHPGAAAVAPIHFETAPIHEPALVPGLLGETLGRHGPACLILADPADPASALPIALAVTRWHRSAGEICPPVLARMDAGIDRRLDCSIHAFGAMSDLADPELMLQDGLDGLARSIHEVYFETQLDDGAQIGSRASMYEWDQLPEQVRDDNRRVADCYRLKLTDLGARLVAGPGEGLSLRESELEALAVAEHNRWMAAKQIDGWVFGDPRDDAARRHPNICPYEALPEPIKELDRQQVRIMTRLVSQGGQRAVRDLVCLVEAPTLTASALAAGTAAARAVLARQYPDRAIVLVGDFQQAAARQALSEAMADGVVVQLLVTRNPEETLDSLGPAERDAARDLYRGADRLHVLPGADGAADQAMASLAPGAHIRLCGPGDRSGAAGALPVIALDASGRIASAP